MSIKDPKQGNWGDRQYFDQQSIIKSPFHFNKIIIFHKILTLNYKISKILATGLGVARGGLGEGRACGAAVRGLRRDRARTRLRGNGM